MFIGLYNGMQTQENVCQKDFSSRFSILLIRTRERKTSPGTRASSSAGSTSNQHVLSRNQKKHKPAHKDLEAYSSDEEADEDGFFDENDL